MNKLREYRLMLVNALLKDKKAKEYRIWAERFGSESQYHMWAARFAAEAEQLFAEAEHLKQK